MILNVLRRWSRAKRSWIRVRLVVILKMSKRSRNLNDSILIRILRLFSRFLLFLHSRLFLRFKLSLRLQLSLCFRLSLYLRLSLRFRILWRTLSLTKWIEMFWFLLTTLISSFAESSLAVELGFGQKFKSDPRVDVRPGWTDQSSQSDLRIDVRRILSSLFETSYI